MDQTSIKSYLTSGVKMICANDVAFTAIRSDGVAVGWGYSQANLGSGLLSSGYSSVVSC